MKWSLLCVLEIHGCIAVIGDLLMDLVGDQDPHTYVLQHGNLDLSLWGIWGDLGGRIVGDLG